MYYEDTSPDLGGLPDSDRETPMAPAIHVDAKSPLVRSGGSGPKMVLWTKYGVTVEVDCGLEPRGGTCPETAIHDSHLLELSRMPARLAPHVSP